MPLKLKCSLKPIDRRPWITVSQRRKGFVAVASPAGDLPNAIPAFAVAEKRQRRPKLGASRQLSHMRAALFP